MKKISCLVVLLLCMAPLRMFAQTEKKSGVELDFGVDLSSRYMWRGLINCADPNVQPWVTLSKGNFMLEFWGLYGPWDEYGELDISLYYQFGAFTWSLNDYFSNESVAFNGKEYFNWKQQSTGHFVETTLEYDLPSEKFPLLLTGSVVLYGDDLNDRGKQFFSTYLEAAFPVEWKSFVFTPWIGGTFNEGTYANGPALTNTGLQIDKTITIKGFEFGANTGVVFNPDVNQWSAFAGLSFYRQ